MNPDKYSGHGWTILNENIQRINDKGNGNKWTICRERLFENIHPIGGQILSRRNKNE